MKTVYICIVLFLIVNGLNGWPTLIQSNDIDVDYKTCKACTSLVTFIDNINTNDTNLLQNSLNNLCNDYSSLPGKQTAQTCKHIVRDFMKLFDKVNKQTFCDQINACPQSAPDHSLQTIGATDDPNCNFCITVVTNVKDIISGGPTELEVKYFVEDACHYLGSFENECVSLSDEYIDTLFSFIRQSLDPKKFCQSVGACNTTTKHKQLETVADISEVINIFPAQMPTLTQLTPLEKAEPIKPERDDMECLICKRIVTYIVQELADNKTEENIIKALERVCSVLPRVNKDKCDAFVEQYANELIHIIIEESDPDLACTLLGVCVPNSVWKPINNPEIEREDSVQPSDTESVKWIEIEAPIEGPEVSVESKPEVETENKNKLCFECELLMHFVQNQIYDYNNEEQIEEFIEHQLCDRVQIVITKDACDHFIQQYGPQVMQLIAQQLFDPTTVCHKELHLCGNSTQTIKTVERPEQDFVINGESERCDMCVRLVQQMDTLLESKSFDKEVAKIVGKTCNTLPKPQRVECELMVEAFAPYFLQMIGHLSNANEICKSIDMCYTEGQVQLLGGHKCTYGPTYWCHTIAHAESCKAKDYCKTKVWKAMP